MHTVDKVLYEAFENFKLMNMYNSKLDNLFAESGSYDTNGNLTERATSLNQRYINLATQYRVKCNAMLETLYILYAGDMNPIDLNDYLAEMHGAMDSGDYATVKAHYSRL